MSAARRAHGNKVVVVTGASAGVGRATALEFASRGAQVALLARGQEGLDSARREIELAGGQRTFALSVDVADADAVDKAASAIEQALGPIDIWVNNAMVTIFAPFKEIAADEFKRVTEVTYLGNVHGTMAALKRMLPRDRGVVVQVSSALAYRSIPLQSAYCGAKHAITGFTDSLRSELKHDQSKVRVTAVQLAAMNTPQFGWARNRMPCKPQPVPPIFQPDDHQRPDNLFEPVAGDPGTHGRFDSRAQAHSTEVWVVEQRKWLLLGGLGLGALLWAAMRRARQLPRNGTRRQEMTDVRRSL